MRTKLWSIFKMTFTKEVSYRALENEIYDLNRQGYSISKSERYEDKYLLFFSKKGDEEFILKRRTLTLENKDIVLGSQIAKKNRFEKFFKKMFSILSG